MLKGQVYKSTGKWYIVNGEDDVLYNARIQGKFRLKNLRLTNPIAVGDWVMMEVVKNEDNTASIVKIIERRNYVVRQSPRQKHQLHVLAANIDQAFLIVTIKDPMLKRGFIDRFLLMTEPYNIPVYIVVNKSDLYDEKDLEIYQFLKTVYESIGYTVLLISATEKKGFDDLYRILSDKITLISGQSGVGKSSLFNAVDPSLQLKVGALSEYTGKGQHTTTFAEMYDLEGHGGKVIDTPGLKLLSFNHFEVLDVAHNFREFFVLSENCRFSNCTHRNEPNCAVKEALEDYRISPYRYENYLSILDEIEDQNYWERASKEY